MKNNLDELEEKASSLIDEQEQFDEEVSPPDFAGAVALAEKMTERTAKAMKEVADQSVEAMDDMAESIEAVADTNKELVSAIKKIAEDQQEHFREVKDMVQQVEVKNQISIPDFPDSLDIKQPKWLGFPKKWMSGLARVKEMTFEDFLDDLGVRIGKGIKRVESVLTEHTTKDKPIYVVPINPANGQVLFPTAVNNVRGSGNTGKYNSAGVMIVEVSNTIPVTVGGATTPNEYAKTLTVADTEYSQLLPAGTKKFQIRCRTSYDVRFSFTTGKVAGPTDPYQTLPADETYWEEGLDLTGVTLYLASDEAGVVVEILAWT